MIAVSTSGKSFGALAAYLTNGRTGQEQDRVAWTASRNLPTADPELAATFMQATATRSDRVTKPVYHIALSFDPADVVDRAAMERVADRLLERLGLAEHQAVIVAHRDRQHPHVHLFVNRVHPETGKAWERWKDQPLIQTVLREEEHALGLRAVPGKLTERPDRERANDREAVGAERASRAASADAPERAEPARKPSRRLIEVIQGLRAHEQAETLARDRYAAALELEAARSRRAHVEAATDRVRAAQGMFERALGQVYRDPQQAGRAFEAMLAQRGADHALQMIRDQPERFGALATAPRHRPLGIGRSEDDGPARSAAREAARLGSRLIAARAELTAVERFKDVALDGSASREEVERATKRVRALDAEAGRRLPSHELERQIGRAVRALAPRELEQLRLLVTTPQFALAKRLSAAVRDMVLGREESMGA